MHAYTKILSLCFLYSFWHTTFYHKSCGVVIHSLRCTPAFASLWASFQCQVYNCSIPDHWHIILFDWIDHVPGNNLFIQLLLSVSAVCNYISPCFAPGGFSYIPPPETSFNSYQFFLDVTSSICDCFLCCIFCSHKIFFQDLTNLKCSFAWDHISCSANVVGTFLRNIRFLPD